MVNHNTNGGQLAIVGTFNSWNTFAALPCQSLGSVWTCGPINIQGRVEWKSITINGNCKDATYRGGSNLVVDGGDGVFARDSY